MTRESITKSNKIENLQQMNCIALKKQLSSWQHMTNIIVMIKILVQIQHVFQIININVTKATRVFKLAS